MSSVFELINDLKIKQKLYNPMNELSRQLDWRLNRIIDLKFNYPNIVLLVDEIIEIELTKKAPRIKNSVLISELCLFTCVDGKRHVGYYHMNGHWYEWDGSESTLFNKIVTKWEYLNSPIEEKINSSK
jgi:hypothetical protein